MTTEIIYDTVEFGKIGWKPNTEEIYFFLDDICTKRDPVKQTFSHPMWGLHFRIRNGDKCLERQSDWEYVNLNSPSALVSECEEEGQ